MMAAWCCLPVTAAFTAFFLGRNKLTRSLHQRPSFVLLPLRPRIQQVFRFNLISSNKLPVIPNKFYRFTSNIWWSDIHNKRMHAEKSLWGEGRSIKTLSIFISPKNDKATDGERGKQSITASTRGGFTDFRLISPIQRCSRRIITVVVFIWNN